MNAVVESVVTSSDTTQPQPNQNKKELHATWRSLLITSLVFSILNLLISFFLVIFLVATIPKLKEHNIDNDSFLKGFLTFLIFLLVAFICFDSLNIFLVAKNLKSKEVKYLSGLPVL